MSVDSLIPLARVVEDLRGELFEAMQEGAGQPIQFRLKPIELELKVAVTKKGEGKGSVKFWVVELGAQGSYESASTHTLKLILEPVGRDGRSEFLISQPSVERPAGG